jgi:hypothetical protein
MNALTCPRCGKRAREIHHSIAAGGRVCRSCHLRAVPDGDSQRIARQGAIARAIRGAIENIDGPNRQKLADRALLIEVADSTDQVLELLDEVERLGVKLQVQP